MHPKYQNHRNEKYLEWIRRQPSIASGKYDSWDIDKGEGRNDPSHTWNTGKKGKRNDLTAVPMTRTEHTDYHSIGHDEFERRYNINFKDKIIILLSKYIERLQSNEIS